MTISLSIPIAEGRTAQVYAWGTAHILKLYRPGWPAQEAAREFALVQQVVHLNVPTPAAHELVQIDGRSGIVFDRVAGTSLLQVLQAHPQQLDRSACLLADLHAALHDKQGDSLPDGVTRLHDKIARASHLTTSEKSVATARLEELPAGDRLCHGDFHVDNVLVTDDGPVIIDWVDATQGDPLSDVARTLLLMRYGEAPGLDTPADEEMTQLRIGFCAAYLQRYKQLRPHAADALDVWQLPTAAGRLSESVGPLETTNILALIRNEGLG